MTDLLAISEAPNNTIIWAFVETDKKQWFWVLAEKNGDDWVGVSPWDDHPNPNSFDDYDWTVLGWKKVERPDLPHVTVRNSESESTRLTEGDI